MPIVTLTLPLILLSGATAAGAAALTYVGLRQLQVSTRRPLPYSLAAVIGAAAAIATMHNQPAWAATIALFIWSSTLAAAASCDAATQRIPTPLVRQAITAVLLLLVLASATHDPWPRLGVAIMTSLAVYALLMLAWRYGTLGRGDTRLGALAGLGLGWVGVAAAGTGLIVILLILLVQALITLARRGNLATTLPYGPALAAGFITAAGLS